MKHTTSIIIHRPFKALALSLDKRLQLTPSIAPLSTSLETLTERKRALVDDEMDIRRRRT